MTSEKQLAHLRKLNSPEHRKWLSERLSEYNRTVRIGENHHEWKGDDAGYAALHFWAERNIPKPEHCTCTNPGKRMELHNISGKYLRDVTDWVWLCVRCHKDIHGNLYPKKAKGRYVRKDQHA